MALSHNLEATHLQQLIEMNEHGSYYTDLELAAAIGKNLLERNKELELLLNSTQDYAEEQEKKSEFLSRQLEEARLTNESRVKLIEEIETNSEQLLSNHTKLKRETKSIRQHNELLTESLQSLLEKCDNYKSEMEDLRRANHKLRQQLSQIPDDSKTRLEQQHDVEKEIVKNQVKKLSSAIKQLELEQNREKSNRVELEHDLSQLIAQNEQLEEKLRLYSKNRNSYIGCEDNDEHEGTQVDFIETHEVMKGCEPLPISFLDELDQQYRELVNKYNKLLEKCKNEGIPYESRDLHMVQRGVQTSTSMQGQEYDSGKPEYKKMFEKIYDKLREGMES